MLWYKLRCFLGTPGQSATNLSADDLDKYFTTKVELIHSSTSSAPPPNIIDRPVTEPLIEFEPVTVSEAAKLLIGASPKQCSLDPVPSWLVKRVSDVIAPVIAAICNASFQQASLPVYQKSAIVRPLLKKSTLDQNDPSSYRPISNLSFISKIVEKAVDARLTKHLDQHHLLPIHQSAYRRCHSTETAIVHMHDAIINAIDHGHIGALILLDMSAAFDTVDHNVLYETLHRRAGVDGSALKWLTDFTKDRSLSVHMDETTSAARVNMFGVPQGSVLGPKQIILYTEDASDFFKSLGITHHFYADDMQGIFHGPP